MDFELNLTTSATAGPPRKRQRQQNRLKRPQRGKEPVTASNGGRSAAMSALGRLSGSVKVESAGQKRPREEEELKEPEKPDVSAAAAEESKKEPIVERLKDDVEMKRPKKPPAVPKEPEEEKEEKREKIEGTEEISEDVEEPERPSRKHPSRTGPQRVSMVVGGADAFRSDAYDYLEESKHLWHEKDTFEALGLCADVVTRLTTDPDSTLSPSAVARRGLGLKRPTSAQRVTIPAAFSGNDLLVRAETGSGKTLAYLIPIVDALVREGAAAGGRGLGTRAAILAPTRELCAQIGAVLEAFVRPFPWIVTGNVSGGENRKSEKTRLRKGVTIVVAPPGRFLDHLRRTASWSLENLRWLVFDEADRLMELGFAEQVKDILGLLAYRRAGAHIDPMGYDNDRDVIRKRYQEEEEIKPERKWQTLLLSATLDSSVQRLAGEALSNPVEVDGDRAWTSLAPDAVSSRPDPSSKDFHTPVQLVQQILPAPTKWRLVTLLAFIRQAIVTAPAIRAEKYGPERAGGKLVVFLSSCASVDFHFALLGRLWPTLVDAKENATPSSTAASSSLWSKDATAEKQSSGGDAPSKKVTPGDSDPSSSSTTTKKQSSEDSSSSKKKSKFSGGSSSSNKAGLSPFLAWAKSEPCLVRLHGDAPQAERIAGMAAFRASSRGVLLATDVASRGIDLPDVDVILQMDPPSEVSEYVHRVGRTARRGRGGRAVLCLAPHEDAYEKVLSDRGLSTKRLSSNLGVMAGLKDVIPPGELVGALPSMATSAEHASIRSSSRADPETADRSTTALRSIPGLARLLYGQDNTKRTTEALSAASRAVELGGVRWQALCEELVRKSDSSPPPPPTASVPLRRVWILPLGALARRGFQHHVRALACHNKAERHIFNPRTLHLGHLAKAFALLEPPSRMSAREDAEKIRLVPTKPVIPDHDAKEAEIAPGQPTNAKATRKKAKQVLKEATISEFAAE